MTYLRFVFINVSGTMVVSDPSVIKDTYDCLEFDKVRKGVWRVEVELGYDMGLKILKATHEDSRIMKSLFDEFKINVYSEQVGVFDALEYRSDKSVVDMPREQYQIVKDGDKWYCAMSHITNSAQYGADAYNHGCLTETENRPHKVFARKSIDGDYVEFEIKL